MSYKLRFHELALAEWKKLDSSVREPLKKKLAERLDNPRVPTAALAGMPDCYKIKLLRVGYRLVYRVESDIVFVTVLAVGKRDKLKVYDTAKSRLTSIEPKKTPVRFGVLKGKVQVSADFDEAQPDEVLAGFEGR